MYWKFHERFQYHQNRTKFHIPPSSGQMDYFIFFLWLRIAQIIWEKNSKWSIRPCSMKSQIQLVFDDKEIVCVIFSTFSYRGTLRAYKVETVLLTEEYLKSWFRKWRRRRNSRRDYSKFLLSRCRWFIDTIYNVHPIPNIWDLQSFRPRLLNLIEHRKKYNWNASEKTCSWISTSQVFLKTHFGI